MYLEKINRGLFMTLKFVCPQVSGNGGTETVLTAVINHLVKEKHKVQLILTNQPTNKQWLTTFNGDVVIKMFQGHGRVNRALYLVHEFMRSSGTDHYIILGANLIKIAAAVRKVFKKKYSITSWIHYTLIGQTMFNPRNLLLADNHWAISSSIKEQLIEMGVSPEKIELIFNPVENYDGPLNCPVNDNELRLVFVGHIQLDKQKNLRELLDAIAKYPGDIHVDFLGATDDLAECQQYAKQLGVTEKLTWHSWTSDPWRLVIQKIHPNAVILTSKYEGLPMVFLEGLMRGIPCITARFPGYSDIVTDGVNGESYPQGNITELVATLKKLNAEQLDAKSIAQTADKFNAVQYFKRVDRAVRHFRGESNVKQ